MAETQNPVAQNTADQQQLGYGPGVSGGPGICQKFTRSEDGHSVKTVNFSRTYVHFLGPGTEYVGPHNITDENNNLVFAYDFGGSIIPFNYSRAAARPRHIWPYFQKCNSYRIMGHSVHLTDLICSRDEVQADGRIATTCQQDSIEVFHDTLGKFRPNNIVPVGTKSLFELNNGFRTVEPRTMEEATLPRAKIQFPAEQYPSTRLETLSDYEISAFDPYNGMFTVKHWNTGEDYELSHSFDSGRIPVGSFAGMDSLACNKNRLSLCNTMLDTVWGVQANMATQVNRYPIQPPHVAFFRFAPYWTANGKAQRRAQFKATYKTTIEFYFSPDCGVDMFEWGSQPEIHSIPQVDPYDQTRSAVDRFNWAVHAEDFVMPLTGYVLTETESHMPDNLFDGIETDRDTGKSRTLDAKLRQSLIDVGYALDEPIRQDGHNITTVVSSGASKPSNLQLAPELSAPVLAAEGFTSEDINIIRAEITCNPPADEVDYTKNEDGIIVDEQSRPILPVQVKQDAGALYTYNDRFYRPAQAWEAIGVTNPPVWTKKDGGRFIPWPKFGQYGRLFGNNLCQIRDIEEVKKLNKVGVAQKMDVVNRSKTIAQRDNVQMKAPAANLKQSQPTVPLQARGFKGGPKFPAPTVPDVNEDYAPFFSAWFTDQVASGDIRLPTGWSDAVPSVPPNYNPSSGDLVGKPIGVGGGAGPSSMHGGSSKKSDISSAASDVTDPWGASDDLFLPPKRKRRNYYGSTIETYSDSGTIVPETCPLPE